MKKAKVIISLQVTFLALTIIFSTGIAFNNGAGQGISLPTADTATNLAVLSRNHKVAGHDDLLRLNTDNQKKLATSINSVVNGIRSGQIPQGVTEIAGMSKTAYLATFADPGDNNNEFIVIISRDDLSAEVINGILIKEDLSELATGVNIYIPTEKYAKTSSAGLVVPVITADQMLMFLQEAKTNLGVFAAHMISEQSSLGTLRFESPVFQKRDVGESIIGSVRPDGTVLNPATPLNEVTSQDSIRSLSDLAKVMASPISITLDPLAGNTAYYMLRGLFVSEEDMAYAFDEKGMRFDITAMIPAVINGELVHTSGHYHNPLIKPEIYMVVSGTAIYLLQQHQMPADADKLSENELKIKLAESPVVRSVAVIAKPGQPVVIPAGWGYVTVNPSISEPLIMANWLTYKQASAYGPYETYYGPSHRLMVDEAGNIGVIRNENYPGNVELSFATPKDVADLGLVTGTPLYDMVNDKPVFEELAWFLDTGSVSGTLDVGELSVDAINNTEAARLLGVDSVSIVDTAKTASAGLAQEVTDALTQLMANPNMPTLERVEQTLQAAYAKYTANPESGARESVDIALQALKSISIHQRAQESVLARAQDVSARPASQTQPVLTVYHDIGSMPSTLKADAIRSLGTQHFRVETLDVNTIPNDLKPENSIIITANLEAMQAALEQAEKEKTKILPISQLENGQFVPFVQLTQQAKDILLLSISGLVSDNILPTIRTRIGNTYTALTGGRFVDIDAYISNPAAYIINLAPAVTPFYEPGQLETLYNMIIQAAQAA